MRIAYYAIPKSVTEDIARYELQCTYDEYKKWLDGSSSKAYKRIY